MANGGKDKHGPEVLDRLYKTVLSRKGADPASSYTAKLFSRGTAKIAQKLGEEAVETVIEAMRGDREKIADESADRTENPLESDEESADEPDHEGDERAEEESEEDRKHIAEVSPSHVQTLLFRREDGWTKTKARTWVRSHPAYHFGKVDETANYIRVRQMDPVKFEPKSFRTITFGKGIKAVIGRRKTG